MEAFNALVRPIVAFAFTAAVIYGFVVGKVAEQSFMGIATMVIAFYFAAREATKALNEAMEVAKVGARSERSPNARTRKEDTDAGRNQLPPHTSSRTTRTTEVQSSTLPSVE